MKLKKEVSLAIIIGLFIALLVTGGILRARRAFQSLNLSSFRDTLVSSKSASTPPPELKLFLELTTPDNSVTTEPLFTINGKTLPGTYIAILGEKGEYLIVPNDLGSFSQDVNLIKGANSLKITVYEQDGNKIEKILSTVYTTAEI